MPIKSYLAHPHKGKKRYLEIALSDFKECEVLPAENEEILVVVTETESKKEEDELIAKLEALPSLKLLAMVSGFDTPKN
ncbi:hypothetical protein RQM65_15540 [Pricia sp. S334]|uniref:Uncharacterized protein n=1 Tax=Pricia mediterranea TaxID=3076079 RepID=A0ABU3L8K7_9FLAO|nr:hypothetical protein [Pricia sp. S334]MDT7830080.1 hypothetical protein [Pricia sp. S334]